MIYQKKDLFKIPYIPISERVSIDTKKFPPHVIKWKKEAITHLGISNKDDLLSNKEFENDAEVMTAIKNNMYGQFIYSNLDAEIFEVMLIQNESSDVYVVAIRTRRKA